MSHQRKLKLEASLKRIIFNKDASEIETFIQEKKDYASSTNYGTDIASVQKLIDDFTKFGAKSDSVNTQVSALVSAKDLLVRANHPDKSAVEAKCDEVVKNWENFRDAESTRKKNLQDSLQKFRQADSVCLSFAEKATSLNNWIDNTSEDISEPIIVQSVKEVKDLQQNQSVIQDNLSTPKKNYEVVTELDQEIKKFDVPSNPYTPYTLEVLTDKWTNVNHLIEERGLTLEKEVGKQEKNEELRIEFAKAANRFNEWLSELRTNLLEVLFFSFLFFFFFFLFFSFS